MSGRQGDADPVGALFQTAIGFHQNGELQRAEHLYREVLRQQPRHADALNMLGVLGCQCGNPGAGAKLIRQAVALDPEHPDYNNNLGLALAETNQPQEAEAAFEQALRKRPRFAEAHFNLANVLRARGDPDRAEKHYRKALRVRRDYVDALNNLGNLLRVRGEHDEAVQLLGKVVRLAPALHGARLNYAVALGGARRVDEALAILKALLESTPEDADAWAAAGHLQREGGNLDEAAIAYQRALDCGKPGAALLNAFALTRFAQNRLPEAKALLEQALTIEAENAITLNYLGMVASATADRATAQACFERALLTAPTYGPAWLNLVELQSDAGGRNALLGRLEQARGQIPREAAAPELDFALGRIYDADERYDDAFTAFRRANDARRGRAKYDARAQARFIDRLVAVFNHEFIETTQAAGNRSDRPVFVLGMPRSGTSLVEQIVASHSQVSGAGELTWFPQQALSLHRRLGVTDTFPDCLLAAAMPLESMANEYLTELDRRAEGAPRVTDKMPYNFLYLGLIAILFPAARIIHCVRDPMATCFSIYTHDLAGNHPYSYDLGDLASAYLGYARIMRHWRATLGLNILDVDYAELTADPKRVAQSMTDFLGLQWEPACLDFHRSPRAVTTASQWQVREPVYTTSREHWRHYAPHLEALAEGLTAATAWPA